MAQQKSKKWLVLIHQIPPTPNSLRVKIWRRLQQVGAVAIKQSVYVMPVSEQSREDLSWTLKAVVAGGGDGSISEVRFVEGLSDGQVVSLFQNARKADYEKIIQEANQLIADWSAGKIDPRDPSVKASAQVARLRRQFDTAAGIDFFKAPGKKTAEIAIRDLVARSTGEGTPAAGPRDGLDALKGKVWVTRRNLFVDRIACGWLVRRFVEDTAVFKFVDADPYLPGPAEIRFDMFEGEYTHEGDLCTFEVMINRLGLRDGALAALAEVIHDIDLKDNKFNRAETSGLGALLTGLAASQPDDEQRLAQGMRLMDNLYAYYQGQEDG